VTASLTLRRLLAALLAFALSFALFSWANRLAADVRYPLAIFCLVLSIVSFGAGLFLISPRLGAAFGRLVAAIVDFFSGLA
jgi:hypothetical protein